MVLALLVNAATRQYKEVPPSFLGMSTNSAAISAMCCPPKEDKETHLFEVRLGIVRDPASSSGTSHGRLTFSTCIHIEKPEEGQIYLQPVEVPQEPSARRVKTKLIKVANGLIFGLCKIAWRIRRRGQ